VQRLEGFLAERPTPEQVQGAVGAVGAVGELPLGLSAQDVVSLMDTVDEAIPTPKRDLDKSFIMPVEDVARRLRQKIR
jgi:translation elongation factor EF-Tu-like GTPase